MDNQWRLPEPPDAEAYIVPGVLSGHVPLEYALRNDDGSWMFLGTPTPDRIQDTQLVHLAHVVEMYPQVADLHDLAVNHSVRWLDDAQAWGNRHETETVSEAEALAATHSDIDTWPYEDPQAPCYVLTRVLEGSDQLRVAHRDDEGSWQYFADGSDFGEDSDDEFEELTLSEVGSRFPEVRQVPRLPRGWYALWDPHTRQWTTVSPGQSAQQS